MLKTTILTLMLTLAIGSTSAFARTTPDRTPRLYKWVEGVGTCSIEPRPGKLIVRDNHGKIIDSAQSLMSPDEMAEHIMQASNEVVYRVPAMPRPYVLIEGMIGDGEPVQLYNSKTQRGRTGTASNFLKNTVKGLCAALDQN